MLVCSNKATLDKHIKDRQAGDTSGGILVNEFELFLASSGKRFLNSNAIRADIMSRVVSSVGVSELNLDENSMQLFSNSLLLIKFFQEMAVEYISLADLEQINSYRDYSKHVSILKEILDGYIQYLELAGYEDMIMIPNSFKARGFALSDSGIEYLKKEKHIQVIYDGLITKFDESIFAAASKVVPLDLIFKTDEYYGKTIDRLQEHSNDVIPVDAVCFLNFSTGELNYSPISNSSEFNISAESLNFSLSYPEYIREKSKGLKKKFGIDDSDIAVICLSDTEYSFLLMDPEGFVFKQNSNMTSTKLHKHLSVVLAKIEDPDNKVNNLILNRLFSTSEMDREMVLNFVSLQVEDITFYEFVESVSTILANYSESELVEFKKALDVLQSGAVFLNSKNIKEFLSLLLFEMSFNFIEDRNSGIQVFRLDEARGADFKYLFILGMERNKFPAFAKKDMFLDSQIRENISLPTQKDRADLQKHYLLNLMAKAHEAGGESFICLKISEGSTPSSFLAELGVHKIKEVNEDKLFKKIKKHNIVDPGMDFYASAKTVTAVVDKHRTLSASKLKTYLTCKRKYYYQYIKSISEQHSEISFNIVDREFGNIVHLVISEVLTPGYVPSDAESMKNEILLKVQEKIDSSNIAFDFSFEYWQKNLGKFVAEEFEKISSGQHSIESVEENITSELFGISINGKPDRVDMLLDGKLLVVDYKTGKTPDLSSSGKGEVDFQPEFMKFLVKKKFNVKDSDEIDFFYRNLKTGKEEKAVSSIERDAAFLAAVQSFVEDDGCYDMTHSKSNCTYCPFAKICGR